jgi:hypothetical protein
MRIGRKTALVRCARLAVLGAVTGAAGVALAAPPQLVSEGGLLVLPNVKVEKSAVPIETAPAKQAGSVGMKAYRDSETGQLRRPTADDLAAELAAAAATPAPAAPSVRITTSANGRRSAQLDESFLSFMVVKRDANGKLAEQCVNGEQQALKALNGNVDTEEHDHAH